MSFAISGLLHEVADVVLGVPQQESAALQFFVITALAIMVEDGVQELTKRALGTSFSSLRINIGYLWVICFMVWLVPTWAYPAARWIRPRQDLLVPFSMIGIAKAMLR